MLSRPLAIVDVNLADDGSIGAEALAGEIWRAAGVAINDHLREDGLAPLEHLSSEGAAAADRPACLRARLTETGEGS